ncbi:MAG: hypothetical protein A3J42_07725 [Candidatus Dadabacteria bacterium RIFCSPHIGHO2_12_FULL_53_21]|jgi:hypothetical protein|nr:MAG: hypothetical protein A3J42_07725 [Candidatus Dadabacteria bacterium RIFCSPHIGHO2_12_FULL_53_21]
MATKKEAAPKKTAGKKAATPKTGNKKSSSAKESVQDKIARVAYELFEKSGRPHGKDVEHWIEAEAIVLGKKKKK